MQELLELLGWKPGPDVDVGDRYEVMAPTWVNADGGRVYGDYGWAIPPEELAKAIERLLTEQKMLREGT